MATVLRPAQYEYVYSGRVTCRGPLAGWYESILAEMQIDYTRFDGIGRGAQSVFLVRGMTAKQREALVQIMRIMNGQA